MRLLLAIDGSQQSNEAVQALSHFASPEELTLVHALDLPDLDHPMITPDMRKQTLGEIEDRLRPEGEALLDQAVASLPQDFGTVNRIHEIGSPADVILETARSAKSNLIILGARGLGSIKELVLGSVSHRVVMHASCPTLVVKSPIRNLRRILLPIEGKEDAEVAGKFLAGQPFREPVEITVMTVWPTPRLPWPITLGHSKLMEEKAIEHAHHVVDEITEQLKQLNYHGTAYVGLGEPAFAIIEQQRALKPDLILIGSHGRRGVSRFLLGSVSHAVLHQASCSVLIVR